MNQEKTQKTNNFRKMLLTIPLLLLSFIALTVSTYAYWNMLTQTEDETITIGEGVALQVNAVAVAPVGMTLVPAGCIVDSAKQVDSITLTYNIKLSRTLTTGLTLSVTPSNVLIGGNATYASFVGIGISTASATVNGADVLVTVIVTLTEPTEESVYNAIINQAITFNVNFTAA